MPASLEIKDEIIEILWFGTFKLGDVYESLNALRDILDGAGQYRILIRDNLQVLNFDATEARQTAYLLESLKQKGVIKTCLVANKRVHYGIGRMINAYCDMIQVAFEVFWDEKTARDWLGR